ncbi:MAG: ESPR-type extended signal peptide-containing protein, partial [Rhodoferax sp.]
MNKTHRIVWSEARQTYVVAHENAASSGKPSSTRKGVVQAVAVALLALGAGQAAAVDSCVGVTVIATNKTDPCLLTTGESVTINNGFSLAVSGASERAVTVEGATGSGAIAAGDILNNGTIASVVSGQSAIRLLPGVSAGLMAISIPRVSVSSITNNGLINAGSEGGIVMEYAADSDGWKIGTTITGDIINTGTITTAGTDAIRGIGATIGGRIVNNSLIQGQIKFFTSVITSGITNTGTVSGPNTAGLNMWPVQVGDIKNTGLIQGTRGVNIGGATTTIASITNDGTINASSGFGLALVSGASVAHGLSNSGTIEGKSFGAQVDRSTVSGGITNSGLIQSVANVSAYALAMFTSTINGGITNTGTIVAQAGSSHTGYAIRINNSTINGGIVNTGKIQSTTGTTAFGININGSVLASITNSGVIEGNTNGIRISSTSTLGSLTNSGTISGSNAIDAGGGGLNSLVIEGANT